MRVETLFEFMQARESIRLNRLAGLPRPWTEDKILQQYRFCNVYREFDSVTAWIAKNWRKPNADDPHLFFAMAVSRYFNLPETLKLIGYPVLTTPHNVERWFATTRYRLDEAVEAGTKVFNPAYIVSTNGMTMAKHHYVLDKVLAPLWQERFYFHDLIQTKATTLDDLYHALVSINGVGSFMAGQIIADLKYAQMRKAKDWWTFAASGPGSRRGLNRVCGSPVDKPWREAPWKDTLDILYENVAQMCAAADMPKLHAQDLQNCLCEFDKYERVRLGEGRPKSLYPGA